MSTIHPTIASALRPFAPRNSVIHDDAPELEEGICPSCNGSGEGMYEGQRCYSCKGSGTRYYEVETNEGEDE